MLVACEYTGRVRDAFRRRGHNVISCDLLPSEQPGPHVQGDVLDLLHEGWDMVLAFPPCTKLASIGAKHWERWRRDGSQREAIEFFMEFTRGVAPRICLENPVGVMSSVWRPPTQYVQPWWFGDPWVKKTGLWLRGLSPLVPTQPVEPRGYWVAGTGSRKGRPTGHEGAKSLYGRGATDREKAHARSATFPGLAEAMATQWG